MKTGNAEGLHQKLSEQEAKRDQLRISTTGCR